MRRQLLHTLSSLFLMLHSTLCSDLLKCVSASVAMALNPAENTPASLSLRNLIYSKEAGGLVLTRYSAGVPSLSF